MATTATDSTRFAFGKNWNAYAQTLTGRQIEVATAGLSQLLGVRDLSGRRFLDIGSGSGVHALAALRLGADEVVAFDFDDNSVATTRQLLEREATDARWRCEQLSVFDLTPERYGEFDVVYSWGVLHHTGDMWHAIDRAAKVVGPGGLLALAIYLKTPFCGLWTWEKRLYTRHRWLQWPLLHGYRVARLAARMTRAVARGQNPLASSRGDRELRGMSLYHDIHDWLGGYPYESATPIEIEAAMDVKGLALVKSFNTNTPMYGLFGSRCAEYLFARPSSDGS